MKKTIIIFIIILISVFCILTFLDYNGQYVAEKNLWHINKKLEEIIKDPKAVPDTAFYKVVRQYETFLKRFPNSNLAPIANMLLARAYTAKEDYNQARNILSKVIKKYPNNSRIEIKALIEIANTYVLENKWNDAIKTYNIILKKYPYTPIGMRVPMIKAKIYVKANNKQKAKEQIKNAINYYQNIVNNKKNSIVGLNAILLIASCHESLGQNQETINTLEEALNKFADSNLFTPNMLIGIIKHINTIALAKIGNLDIAINVYNRFIEKHPKHPFNKIFSKVIKQLQQLKKQLNKNILSKDKTRSDTIK